MMTHHTTDEMLRRIERAAAELANFCAATREARLDVDLAASAPLAPEDVQLLLELAGRVSGNAVLLAGSELVP